VIDDLKEFIDETEAAARAKAARHLNVSEEELDARLVPPELEIANLAGRVIVLASVRRAPPVLGPVGDFVKGVIERMGIDDLSSIEERKSERGITVTVDSARLAAIARERELLPALGHLAERAAEQAHGDAEIPVRVELAGRGRDRDRDRGRGNGRRDRPDDRGRDGRRERGGRRDRGRGGRDRGRGRRDEAVGREAGPENPELQQRALESGRRALETGEATTLEEMNSRDRWVVHNALKELEGIESESVGEGRLKRVKIYPA
jgi:predicted RNA-binding protein Jag